MAAWKHRHMKYSKNYICAAVIVGFVCGSKWARSRTYCNLTSFFSLFELSFSFLTNCVYLQSRTISVCSVWQLFSCCEQKIFHALPDMAKCQTLLRLAEYLEKMPKSRKNVRRITIICWEWSGGETTTQFLGHFFQKIFFVNLVNSFLMRSF